MKDFWNHHYFKYAKSESPLKGIDKFGLNSYCLLRCYDK